MKKPKIFNEWFETVFSDSEQGAYNAYEEWGDEYCDKCYEFLEKLLKVEQVGEDEE